MNLQSNTDRYGSASIWLHWFMLLLIGAVYACIELREQFPKGSEIREALKMWHYMLGLSVFVLTWVRLLFRKTGPTPHIHSQSRMQEALAKLVHVSLYVLMIVMPLLGWLSLSADGKAVPFFGLQLPPLLSANKDLVETFEETHEVIGTIGYVLIGVHAVAALYHHYVKHDDTLKRMLP
jgi:cytochrome b561